MTVMFDFERLQAAPAVGEARAGSLADAAGRISAAAWHAGFDPAHFGAVIGNGQTLIRDVVAVLRSMLAVLQAMIDQARKDGWEAGTFASREEFVAVCAAAAGLLDRSQLSPELRSLVSVTDQIMVDRAWLEQQSAAVRRRWLALLCLRWLPQVNAAGAFNCIDGVLKGFDEIGAITPGSFASLVDAEILCDIAMGLDEALYPGEYHQRNDASLRWKKFFEHQRQLGRMNKSWDDASSRLWAHAEQRATERGYDWAITRGADPSDDLAAMTLLSEVFRWVNRQHGGDTDPLRLIASANALQTGVSAKEFRDELYWLFDPRNHDFTYRGVKAVHELVEHGEGLIVRSPEDLKRWRDVVPIPTSWEDALIVPLFGPILPSTQDGTARAANPQHLSAAALADMAHVEQSWLDGLRRPIAAANLSRDGACTLKFNLTQECK